MGYAFDDDLTGLPLPDSELLGIAVMQAQIRDFFLNPEERVYVGSIRAHLSEVRQHHP